ncbi:MAG TPA: AAA family ATPase, partial [Gammaproteobacteria bacterium]|nr:AAA family ATPase [Gammaproteobacteria bacterium]
SNPDMVQTNSNTTSSVMLNTILYGPPGTGKTYNTVNIAKEILGAASLDEITSIGRLKKEFPNRIDFVTFHQSFAYDDFVEGLRASTTDTGSLTYKVEEGIFKRICQNVEPGKPSVLIIDEINRGNISKIFGELITLIEDTKRQGEDEELVVTLPYSKESFSVPKELHIIGTMNTADRSLVMIDTALRRRFNFIEMMPEPELLENIEGIDCPKLLQTINERIEQVLDKEHAIGHSFFIKCKTAEDVINVFKNNLLPLLEEYFFDDFDKIQPILGNHFYEQVEFDSSWTNDEITINENIIRRRKDIFSNKNLFIKAVKSIYS